MFTSEVLDFWASIKQDMQDMESSDTSVPEVSVEAARLAMPLELQEIKPATEMPTTKVVEASKVPTAAWHASMIAPNMKADLDAYGTANMKMSCIS